MLPNATTQPAYTFADLLRDLQALPPEQLAQQAKVWGECPMQNLRGVEVAAENYAVEDGEAWAMSDLDPDRDGEDVYVEKGTAWVQLD